MILTNILTISGDYMRIFALIFLFTPVSILGMMRASTRALASASRSYHGSRGLPGNPDQMSAEKRLFEETMLQIQRASAKRSENLILERISKTALKDRTINEKIFWATRKNKP